MHFLSLHNFISTLVYHKLTQIANVFRNKYKINTELHHKKEEIGLFCGSISVDNHFGVKFWVKKQKRKKALT